MANAGIESDCEGRVLVVEDDRGIALGLRALLISRGFVVDVEYDPDAALRRVSEQHYDVVVADFDLGDRDGLDLVRRVRNLSPDLPVLAVTAVDHAEAMRACEDLGLVGCFEKPVDPERLIDAVVHHARS